jgi:hypothetical protein
MNPDPPPAEPETRRAVMARDAGLRRISATTRWVTTAVVALSGALALIASNTLHGHAATTATQNSSTTVTNQQQQQQQQQSSPSGRQDSSGAIQQPSQTPQSTAQQPVVVSGGS